MILKTTLDKIVSGEAFGEEFVEMLKKRGGKEAGEIKVYKESELSKFPSWIDIAENIDPDSLSEEALAEIEAHRNAKKKQLDNLFLNLASILREGGKPIQYGEPWYTNRSKQAGTGFTIIMYHIENDGYTIATKILETLGCNRINRECGPTIAALFDTVEEKEAAMETFVTAMAEAEKKLALLGDKTPLQFQ